MSGECTTIIVAHRLSTVRNANRIFVFNEGRIIENGTYEALMEAQGSFYNLVKSQNNYQETAVEEGSRHNNYVYTIQCNSHFHQNNYVSENVETNNEIFREEKYRRESYVDIHKFKHRKVSINKKGMNNMESISISVCINFVINFKFLSMQSMRKLVSKYAVTYMILTFRHSFHLRSTFISNSQKFI